MSSPSPRLPAPAPVAIASLVRLGTDRVRALRRGDGPWTFNYSLIKLEAPELAELLTAWEAALATAVAPLRVSSLELTFARPLPPDAPIPDRSEALIAFARACSELIGQVAPQEPVTVSLSWSRVLGGSTDALNDWRLDLDPVRDGVGEAAARLYRDLDGWLDGLDSLLVQLEFRP